MSSTGTARFFPGPHPSRVTIVIKNGDVIPTDKIVYVNPGAIIKFSNIDPENYTLTFFVSGEDRYDPFAKHTDVNLFLPAYGSATMVADRCVLRAVCEYEVEKTPLSTVGVGVTIEFIESLRLKIDEESKVRNAQPEHPEAQNALAPKLRAASGRAGGGGGGTVIIGS
jgi:hypothetical protein